jgi:hypothetical protein
MRISLYSNKIDNVVNKINSDKFSINDYTSIRNQMKDISLVYKNENILFEKLTKNLEYRKKLRHKEPGALSDRLLGLNNGHKFNPIEVRDNIIENVKQRNKQVGKKVNIDFLTKQLGNKYLNKLKPMEKITEEIPQHHFKQSLFSYQNTEENEKDILDYRLNKDDQGLKTETNFYPSTTATGTFYTNASTTDTNSKTKYAKFFTKPVLSNIKNIEKKSESSTNIKINPNINDNHKRKSSIRQTDKNIIIKDESKQTKNVEANENKQQPRNIKAFSDLLNSMKAKKNNINRGDSIKTVIENQVEDDKVKLKINVDFIKQPTIINGDKFQRRNTQMVSVSKPTSPDKLLRRCSILETILRKSTLSEEFDKNRDNETKLKPDSPSKLKMMDYKFFHTLTKFSTNRKSKGEYEKSPITIATTNLEHPKKKNKRVKSHAVNTVNTVNTVANLTPSAGEAELKRHSTNIYKKSHNRKIPLFRSGAALNNFLIRDFLIGDQTDLKSSSKNKYEMTTKMFAMREDKIRERIDKEREEYEIEKYGSKINAQNSIDKTKSDEFDETIDEDKFKSLKKGLDRKHNRQLREKSKKLVEMIEDLSNSADENLEEQGQEKILTSLVNRSNLDRVIRIRNILKHQRDTESDHLGIEDIMKYKEQMRMNDYDLILTLEKLGPPSFLKKKFRNTTIDKYKVVSGKYFGTYV